MACDVIRAAGGTLPRPSVRAFVTRIWIGPCTCRGHDGYQIRVLGGIPLMLGTGAGSELRQPLGYAMVGGLALSQLLTLFTTPIIYLYLDRLQSRLAPRRH
jgi:hypothetical protein